VDALIQITADSQRNKNLFSDTGTQIHLLPPQLLKASVQPARKNTLWLFDIGQHVADETITTCTCFKDFIHLRCITNQWCFENLEIPTDYQPLLNEIRAGQVWLVSDGSFFPSLKYGSAAWILEGKTSKLRIMGRVITPGESAIQSSYRSELTGILAAITVMNALTRLHNIHAVLNLHCDCKSGLKKGFSLSTTSFNDSSFDIIRSIHQEL
jgi:hypothetical protein